jgi:hypothetical protein
MLRCFYFQERLSPERAELTEWYDCGPRHTSKPDVFPPRAENGLRGFLPQSVNKMGPDGPCASESSNSVGANSQMFPVSATVPIRHYHSSCPSFAALEAVRSNLEMTSAPSNGERARMYARAKLALHRCRPNEPTLVAMDALSPVRDSWAGRAPPESQLLAKPTAVTGCKCPDAGFEAPSTVLEAFLKAHCFAENEVRELLGWPRDKRAQNLTVPSRGCEERLQFRGVKRVAPLERRRTIAVFSRLALRRGGETAFVPLFRHSCRAPSQAFTRGHRQ